MKTEFAQIFELTVSEKLQLLEDLWDSIAQASEKISVLDWQKEELAKRKAAFLHRISYFLWITKIAKTPKYRILTQPVHGKPLRSEFV